MSGLPPIEYTPLAVAVIALLILWFVLRNQVPKPQQFSKEILAELKLMNDNHLNSIVKSVDEASRQLSETIHNDNTRIIQLLGEIKGGLTR